MDIFLLVKFTSCLPDISVLCSTARPITANSSLPRYTIKRLLQIRSGEQTNPDKTFSQTILDFLLCGLESCWKVEPHFVLLVFRIQLDLLGFFFVAVDKLEDTSYSCLHSKTIEEKKKGFVHVYFK